MLQPQRFDLKPFEVRAGRRVDEHELNRLQVLHSSG